ncbi:MAG: hypothetical protein WCH34_18870, partial [Bacteroidota bacterium]
MKNLKFSLLGLGLFFLCVLFSFTCRGNIESPPPPPINDECSGAIAITVDTICNFITYTNVDATASVGVPAPGCANYIGADVWFSVVVPTSGRLIFDSHSQGIIDGGMAIYSGNCGSLTLISCNDNSSNYGSMPLINQEGLIPGSTIYIRFWRNNSVIGGAFDLCIYDPPKPINDDCTGAIPITPGTSCSFTTYTNEGATSSTNIPAPGCAGYIGGDVWFSVIVPISGHLVIDSQNGIINNAGMAIYTGVCDSLILIACDDNSSINALMPIIDKYGLIPGSTIYIRFWKNNSLNGGSFGLCVYDPPIPINDECSGAISITIDTTCNYLTYTNAGATASLGIPPTGSPYYLGGDVWFKVVVPASGNLIFSSQYIPNGIPNAGIAIYYGSCDSLTLITYSESGSFGTMPKIIIMDLLPDSVIFIRYWRHNSITGGIFGLCVYDPSPPIIQSPCTNLEFEDGFTGWYGIAGNPTAGIANAPSPTFSPDLFNTTSSGHNFTLMTGGTDHFGGFPVVFNGLKSLRLSDSLLDETYNAASIEQRFLVTEANTNFIYNYAVVLQYGYNHTNNIQAFFHIDLFDAIGLPISCGTYSVVLPNSAFFQSPVSLYTYYKPWATNSINLSSYLGQTVKVRFTASDCAARGHYGYAYIDCSCSHYEIIAPGSICLGQSATLSAPVGALSYSWSPGGDTTSSITVSPSSTTNYSCLIATQGNTPCYYTLTSTVTVVANTNPVAGSNSLPICSGQTLQLTSNAAGANTYHWTGPNNFVSSDQNPIITNVTNNESGFYTVTSSIGSGCVGVDSVKIIVLPTITNSLNPVICQGNSITIGQHNYSISGTYYDTLTTSMGCDSII